MHVKSYQVYFDHNRIIIQINRNKTGKVQKYVKTEQCIEQPVVQENNLTLRTIKTEKHGVKTVSN